MELVPHVPLPAGDPVESVTAPPVAASNATAAAVMVLKIPMALSLDGSGSETLIGVGEVGLPCGANVLHMRFGV